MHSRCCGEVVWQQRACLKDEQAACGTVNRQPNPALTLLPAPQLAARNPNAAAVLAAAAEQAAKREARLAANPKPPKGAARKRKPGEVWLGKGGSPRGVQLMAG